MFSRLGPASLSLSSVKFGKGGYAVFRNEHFHFGVAVQELPFWFCTLFRFRGHCHFLVKQTLGIHFRRNPLSRNSWRKRDPVSKEKDVAFEKYYKMSIFSQKSASIQSITFPATFFQRRFYSFDGNDWISFLQPRLFGATREEVSGRLSRAAASFEKSREFRAEHSYFQI